MERAGHGGPALHEHLEDVSPPELVEDAAEVAVQLERRVDPGCGRCGAEDDPQGSRPATWRTVRAGIVGAHRAGTDEDGVALGAQTMGVGAGGLAPVIHRLVPSGAAVRPSRVAASLSTTSGRPVVRWSR